MVCIKCSNYKHIGKCLHLHIHYGTCCLRDKRINDKYFHIQLIKGTKMYHNDFVFCLLIWFLDKGKVRKESKQMRRGSSPNCQKPIKSSVITPTFYWTSTTCTVCIILLNPDKNCACRHCYPHFRDKETKNQRGWASLVVQWLRICLPMQGTRVRALVWEDPTCRGATMPVSHNY